VKRVYAIIVIGALASACASTQATSTPQPCEPVRVVSINRPVKNQSVEPVEAPSHICGAKTKSGGTCTRKVKGEGYCWQHQTQN